MGIAVTQRRQNEYLIQIFEPELTWVRELAKSFGMTRASIVSVSLGHGLTHYKVVDEHLSSNGKDANEERAG